APRDNPTLPAGRSEGVSPDIRDAREGWLQPPHPGRGLSPVNQPKEAGASQATSDGVALAFPVSSRKNAPAASAATAKPFVGAIFAAELGNEEEKGLATMERLHAMMTKGIISAEEYEKQKAELLAVSKMEKLHGLMLKGIISAEEYETQKFDLLKKLL
ncbi:MAG: SHOCT domain-containing protein, partial [Candidatus Methylumidiphilus sp.]